MHDEHGPVEVNPESKAKGYEVGDISVPIILKWGLGLVISFILISIVTLFIYQFLVTYRYQPKPDYRAQSNDLAPAQTMQNAGIPVVQSAPVADIKDFRTKEDARVAGYGAWKDGDGKSVNYIPIDRAMQIIQERGLPQVPAGGTMPIRTNTNAVTPPTATPPMPAPTGENGAGAPAGAGANTAGSPNQYRIQEAPPPGGR
ncbi:MAG TPA: hypothetical protein VKU00_34435 [Chthonomonadaceae bacterium]|nr:hypothetical protein [Chthonomonadaceae bacterium]